MAPDARLLIVGGGRGQLHLYKAAKELQLPTTMLDSRQDLVATHIADYVVHARPEDYFLACEELNDSLVISDQSDFAQDWVFRMRKKFRQPVGMHSRLTDTGFDKSRLREFLDSSRLNWLNPRWIVVSKDSLSKIQDKIPFGRGQEIVMKPINGQGSEGVKFGKFQDSQTLAEMLGNEDGVHIFEEKLAGPQFSVDSVSLGGEHAITAVGAKRKFRKMPALDESIIFSPSKEASALGKVQEQLLTELGITQGFLHSEFTVTEAGVRLIEFGLRGGGGGISSHVAPFLTDSSITRDFLAHRLGLEKVVTPKMLAQRRVLLRFYTSVESWYRANERLSTLEGLGTQLLSRLETDSTKGSGTVKGPRKALIVVGCHTDGDLQVLEDGLRDNWP